VQEVLSKLIGKKVDIYCDSASSLRGKVIKVEAGVLHLTDAQQQKCYVAIDKIVVVWEVADDAHQAGFVAKH
jgi:hypothetical protein